MWSGECEVWSVKCGSKVWGAKCAMCGVCGVWSVVKCGVESGQRGV